MWFGRSFFAQVGAKLCSDVARDGYVFRVKGNNLKELSKLLLSHFAIEIRPAYQPHDIMQK